MLSWIINVLYGVKTKIAGNIDKSLPGIPEDEKVELFSNVLFMFMGVFVGVISLLFAYFMLRYFIFMLIIVGVIYVIWKIWANFRR